MNTVTNPAQNPAANPPSTYPVSSGFTKRGQLDLISQPSGQLIFGKWTIQPRKMFVLVVVMDVLNHLFETGGIDHSKIDGDIHYLRVSAPRKNEVKGWNVCIREANFGKKLKLHQYKYAIASISSSSPFITMPQAQGIELYHLRRLPSLPVHIDILTAIHSSRLLP